MNVPVQEFLRLPGAAISFSVEEVQFRQCTVKLSSGEILSPVDSLRSYLSHDWILNDDWVYRWGHWWNCNAVKFAKVELSIYWRMCFGLLRLRICSPYAKKTYRQPLWLSVLQGVGWVMARRPLITAQFWLAIWSGLCVVDKDQRLSFRWRTSGEKKVEDKGAA
ncbi:hypothetical protein [Pseudomonas gingeri]